MMERTLLHERRRRALSIEDENNVQVQSSTGYSMDFTESFQRASKRSKAYDTRENNNEIEGEKSIESIDTINNTKLNESIQDEEENMWSLGEQFSFQLDTSWRLPLNQSLEANEIVLNQQLEHLVHTVGLTNGEQLFEIGDEVCTINLQYVMDLATNIEERMEKEGPLERTTKNEMAEKSIRNTMDLISYLMYLRNHELARQTALNERISMILKETNRKNQLVQRLTTELEVQKQNIAYMENQYKAKELAAQEERRLLLGDKKNLEILCTRLQGVETGYKAQLRRKDAEYERLRKNFQDSITRANKISLSSASSCSGNVHISEYLLNNTKDKHQVTSKANTHENQLSQQIVRNLEQKSADLMMENDEMTKKFLTLQKQVESLEGQYRKAAQLFLAQKSAKCESQQEFENLTSVTLDDFKPHPFKPASKKEIPSYIANSASALEEKLNQFDYEMRQQLMEDHTNDSDDIIANLRQKLEEAHTIILEQDSLLQASLLGPNPRSIPDQTSPRPHAFNPKVKHNKVRRRFSFDSEAAENSDIYKQKHSNDKDIDGNTSATYSPASSESDSFTADTNPLNFSMLASAAEELEFEKCSLAKTRHNLEHDRKLLEAQAIKLDQDRLAFEMAKQEQLFRNSNTEIRMGTHSDHNVTSSQFPNRSFVCATPPRRRIASRNLDMDVSMAVPESPLALAVPATPNTAALLRNIGLEAPIEPSHGNVGGVGKTTDFSFLSPIAPRRER